MIEAELGRRARVSALIAFAGVPVGFALFALVVVHRQWYQYVTFAPFSMVLLWLGIHGSDGGRRVPRVVRLSTAEGVCVAPPLYRQGVQVALAWILLGAAALTIWAVLPPDPGFVRGVVLAALVPWAVAVALACVAVVSLARGRPCLRLYPDRIELADLFVTQVVPCEALGSLDAWTPAAPWIRRWKNVDILFFPLSRPELVTYRGRVPFATWVARRRAKPWWFMLTYQRFAVTVEGIAEAVTEYAQRANPVPDAR